MSLFFFIGSKSNINHEEKKKRKKIHGVHDGEQKQEQQTTSKKIHVLISLKDVESACIYPS